MRSTNNPIADGVERARRDAARDIDEVSLPDSPSQAAWFIGTEALRPHCQVCSMPLGSALEEHAGLCHFCEDEAREDRER